jgi:hypothetical protein
MQNTAASSTIADEFARQGYAVLPALLAPDTAGLLWTYVQTKLGTHLMPVGDAQVPGTPNSYGDPMTEGLLAHLCPRLEALLGRRLFPTYSYMRLYKTGDALARHRDRAACEISLSVNAGQVPDAPWALHIEGADGPRAVDLAPGDAVVYRGIERTHWRDAYAGESLLQIFLHYVDADGPHAAEKFDRRPALMIRPVKRTIPGKV